MSYNRFGTWVSKGKIEFDYGPPGKRNLSSPSTSPSLNDKKPKIFVSPNRFEMLQDDDDSNENVILSPNNHTKARESQSQSSQIKIQPRSQPIYIKNITNFSIFKNKLIQLTGINRFTYKASPSYLIVRPHGPDNSTIILKHLKSSATDFHTFHLHNSRSFRVVISNLHHSTLTSDISNALTELGYSVKHIVNTKKNKLSLPLLSVELNTKNNNSDIFTMTMLLHTSVVVEKPYKSFTGPPQCHKYQAYGHMKIYCWYKTRYVKCGEEHLTEICPKDSSHPAKCTLCAGAHTSSYKGCPIYKKHAASLKKYIKEKSLPPAPTPVKTAQSVNQDNSKNKCSYADIATNQPPPISIDNTIKHISEISVITLIL
jgi:hypothetical protein|uniref:Nucleic-acid-binding protein n=1 Tax=Sipha flava TaxID=143950 RepID=A0A2S2QQT0_9HEMI